MHTQEAETVLLYEPDSEVCLSCCETLAKELPQTRISSVSSPSEYRKTIQEQSFDIVVLGCDLLEVAGAALIQELRLKDREPSVLVVSREAGPEQVAALYNAGCDRFISKNSVWLDELVPAIRHLVRLRKLEEENLRIRAKLTEANRLLEEKNRRLDDFSMTIAHDIRGPLAGISMKLDYIIESYVTQVPERCQHLLLRALDSSRRLTDIVQAMYEYAKLGAKAAKMTHVDLVELVNDVIGDLNFDQALDIKIGVSPLPKVWGNADLLRRVFVNLISNAVKYNDKPEIIVNIETQSTIDRGLARYAEVIVSDNGPGIDVREHKAVFDMFTRGPTHKSGVEGLGLGLSVVQRIMDLHFGQVRIESSVGAGTKVVLLLPLEQIHF